MGGVEVLRARRLRGVQPMGPGVGVGAIGEAQWRCREHGAEADGTGTDDGDWPVPYEFSRQPDAVGRRVDVSIVSSNSGDSVSELSSGTNRAHCAGLVTNSHRRRRAAIPRVAWRCRTGSCRRRRTGGTRRTTPGWMRGCVDPAAQVRAGRPRRRLRERGSPASHCAIRTNLGCKRLHYDMVAIISLLRQVVELSGESLRPARRPPRCFT